MIVHAHASWLGVLHPAPLHHLFPYALSVCPMPPPSTFSHSKCRLHVHSTYCSTNPRFGTNCKTGGAGWGAGWSGSRNLPMPRARSSATPLHPAPGPLPAAPCPPLSAPIPIPHSTAFTIRPLPVPFPWIPSVMAPMVLQQIVWTLKHPHPPGLCLRLRLRPPPLYPMHAHSLGWSTWVAGVLHAAAVTPLAAQHPGAHHLPWRSIAWAIAIGPPPPISD